MPNPVSSHLAAHLRQAQTTNAEGAPCWLDLGLCDGLGSPTVHLGQAQTTNAKRAPLLAGHRFLLQPGLPNLFKSALQKGRRRLYQKLSVAVTDYIISMYACKSYAINAVSGFTKKCLLVMYHFKVKFSFLGLNEISRSAENCDVFKSHFHRSAGGCGEW